MILRRVNQSTLIKTYSSAIFSTINPTQIGLELNLDLHGTLRVKSTFLHILMNICKF